MRKLARQSVTSDPVLENAEVIHEESGENLMSLEGSTPSVFGINLAKRLFTEEEILTRMIDPQRSTGRPELDSSKVNLIKRCVLIRFPGDWRAAKEAINQVGRDAKRKGLATASPLLQKNGNN